MEILDIGIGNIAILLTGLLTISTSVLSGKLNKYYKVLKELITMVEDGNISKEELQKFVKAIKNL